jgi:metallo-beta-lactamase class B
MPSVQNTDGIFVAGSFNQWNPADSNTLFTKENNKWIATIKNVAANEYLFKCTRGSWQKTEATADGKSIANHNVHLISDTTIQITIDNWTNDVMTEKMHTASANVHIIDTAFFIPQLNRYRKIWLYLPADYERSKKHYPVMYMQDGQNLFDEFTSAFGEWGVDECLDSLQTNKKRECIIVGIDNGGAKRMNEYNPYGFIMEGGTYASQKFLPEGDAYVDFLTKTLKPFIDLHYRTLQTKENTIIAGSSLGGVIAYYAALKYPDVYGKAGIFSPAFWTAPQLSPITDSVTDNFSSKFFFYIGGEEGEKNIALMNEIEDKLAIHSTSMIYSITDGTAKHNELAWRKWFPEFYKWMMADGFNYVTQSVE